MLTLDDRYSKLDPVTVTLSDFVDLRRLLCGNPGQSGEGVFERVVYSPEHEEFCVQAIVFYWRQLLPYHRHDYAPIFLYLDRDKKLNRIVFDRGHHRARTIEPTDLPNRELAVAWPWHQFQLVRSGRFGTFVYESHSLTDEVIQRWTMTESSSQIKLRTTMVNPWASELTAANATFRDRSLCPVCGRPTDHDGLTTSAPDVLAGDVRCKAGHRYRVEFDARTGLLKANTVGD